MAVNKNFVVKNGLEVDTDLIFADASTNKVGIGSTIPGTELDVKGGIAVTDINASGVGTIVTLRSTTGIITTVDAVNIRGTNLNISGITTVVDVAPRNLNVSGVTSTASLQVVGTGNMPLGIITNAQGTNINYTGIGTIANVIFTKDAVGTGATIGAAVGVVTYYGDGVHLLNTGGGVGIGTSTGIVGYGFTTLNFIGAGNTFKADGTSIDISISGGGGSGSVSISSVAPTSPSSGDLWYSTEYGRTFVWFDEETLGIGNTAVWVDASPFNNGGQFLSKYGDNAYGAIGYTGGTTSQASIYYTSDPNTGIYFPSTDHVGVVAGGTASLVVNPNGVTVTGILTGNGSGLTGVASTDNINTGTAVTITNNVNISGILTATTSVIGLAVTSNNTGIDVGSGVGIITANTFSGGKITVNNGTSSFGDDVTFTGDATNLTWDKSASLLQFPDNGKAAWGSSGTDDLSIYHNSATTADRIDSGNKLEIRANASTKLLNDDGSVTYAAFYEGDKRSEIYYNNVKSIETTGIGASILGTLVSTAATVGTGVTINNTGIDMGIAAGICTAKEFYGDGSNLTGIAAGGSGEFNTSISGATQYDVTTSMATAYTANASSDHRTIVHSIHICNISAAEATISGEIQASFSFAHTIPVPAGSAVELLKQPKVLGPSETIELQASANSSLEATIIVEYKEDTDFWDAQVDLTSAATMTDIYTSSSNPSVVQSILLANDDGSSDVKARVAWTDGSNNIQSYLCYDMVIPADATVELCEKPKYLASGYKLRGYANQADRLEITASGKQITS